MKRDTEQAPGGAQEPAPQGLAYLRSRQFAAVVILRFFAVLRLLALIILTSVLLFYSLWEGLVWETAERLLLFALFLVNAPITALLWAGAFAGKWRCLPAYVICEVGFCLWNLYRYYWTLNRKDSVFLLSITLFLVFFGLFIPLIIVRYYRFLRDQFDEKTRLLSGNTDLATPPDSLGGRVISPQTAGVVLRVVAVLRLLGLNIIAAAMLEICVFYHRRDVQHDNGPQMFVTLFMINTTVTALLWAGSFAEARRCLPVYAICEVACSAWMVFCFMLFVTVYHTLATFLFFAAPFLVLFGLYIPLIVVRYYRFLSERDQQRKRHLYEIIEQS